MKLTAKQRRFVEEYQRLGRGSEAARRAGYSPKSAAKVAWALLRRDDIQQLLGEERKRHEARGSVTAVSVMERLADIRDAAIREGNLNVALRAEELRGRHIGMFGKALKPELPRLEEMTEDQILQALGLSKEDARKLVADPGGEK